MFKCLLLGFAVFLICFDAGAQRVDPTRPVAGAVTSSISDQVGVPKLSGIFHKDGRKYAIINQTILSERQKWRDIELLKVKESSVILIHKQQRKEVLLSKPLDIKKDNHNEF